MPNWKKLITSGSDASLNELSVDGTLILNSVVNAATDTDKFLVLDSSGNVDFRTGANVLSDIGAQAAGSYLTTATTFGGDVSGTYNAIVVGNDSHTHNANNLTGNTLASGVIESSLTAVGTIGTGTWQGTAIDDSYISSAANWNAKLDSAGTIANLDYARFDSNGDLAGRSYSEVKSDLSLGNVENTALSTWAGSSNITTVGTISTGTWAGSVISLAYGGTGASLADPNDDRILFWDDSFGGGAGSVAWLDIGSGLSITNQTLSATAGGGSGYEWFDGTTYATASVDISVTGSITAYKSGSTGDDVVMAIDGAQGRLFEITDQLSGSLFSVNDISGIPIFEVFSDDTVNIGTFNNEAIVVAGDTCTATGSFTGIFKAEDGAALAPSITFNDDTDTGFYRGTANTISVTVAGTQMGTINDKGWRVNNGALGVDVAASTTDGRIDAGNDIVAFSSDKRLKENIKLIEKPLDKLDKLSGFTFNWNEKAEEVAGFDREQSMVGVFAQDVESVLPQAVKRAPFDNDGKDGSLSGENYLTVQYEKLVPLLIESIKELKAEIEELKRIV